MGFNIDEKGNITMFQGDSGTILVSGLNTDRNYSIYFAVQNKNRQLIGNELVVNANKSSSVVFELTGDFTDLMTVPKNQPCEIYYYGIKQCTNDGYEDTVLIGGNDIGALNTITVYPKKVDGV